MSRARSGTELLGCDVRFPGHAAGPGCCDPTSLQAKKGLFYCLNLCLSLCWDKAVTVVWLQTGFRPVLHVLVHWLPALLGFCTHQLANAGWKGRVLLFVCLLLCISIISYF